tara:strand:- start:5137 stop:5424 length:288 start_codon:yes stop_codon:yes gene_type:complete
MSDHQTTTKITLPVTIEVPDALARLLPDGDGSERDVEMIVRYLALCQEEQQDNGSDAYWREQLGSSSAWERDHLVVLRRVPAITPKDKVKWVKIS